ncbi:N-acetylmannosamine-6-phosphate 2-epimerase [Actinoallomurus iriomotensis]|uniref:Putative N-acetylmannosamine-6-phosphate 2-epimerase n=1 Tax=Actinoallomurus iriomotensis TaxID=478107 RepID=A0A9W6VZ46_9ACTN|nr:putative N-acetylmannosamine-6-phosphate 2-epimerase [Actinoallomurus iriomotensis]GLY90773.1 putative N-acetylmannosamine-6-phosphate 2-epimerase [Actinoallomurus iriomotensis]
MKSTPVDAALRAIESGLVVSCQAAAGNPLRGPHHMAAMAQAAAAAGATGIRAEGADDVAAVKAATGLPVIGIRKTGDPGVFITPTYADAESVVAAGASIVATDGTARPRPDGGDLATLIEQVHDRLGVPVMADVDSVEAGRYAHECGADLLASTLSGYTGPGAVPDAPDIALVAALVAATPLPVVAEGRIRAPEEARAAFAAGAFAVVVGTAITNPMEITRRFVTALDLPEGAT